MEQRLSDALESTRQACERANAEDAARCDGMDRVARESRRIGRLTGSYVTPEELAAMGGPAACVPERRRQCRVTHGGVSVTVECPRAQVGAWRAWLEAFARQSGWDEDVSEW